MAVSYVTFLTVFYPGRLWQFLWGRLLGTAALLLITGPLYMSQRPGLGHAIRPRLSSVGHGLEFHPHETGCNVTPGPSGCDSCIMGMKTISLPYRRGNATHFQLRLRFYVVLPRNLFFFFCCFRICHFALRNTWFQFFHKYATNLRERMFIY